MKRIFILISAIALFGKFDALAQNDKFKALFIYNFTKYIEWPKEYEQGEFVIGILGSSSIVTELESISGKRKVGMQDIVVQQFNSVGDIRKCHILYIPPSKTSSLSEVLPKVHGTSTLIITDAPGLALKGAAINFVVKGNKQDFEINPQKFEEAKLKLNNTLLTLGTVVSQ